MQVLEVYDFFFLSDMYLLRLVPIQTSEVHPSGAA